MAYDVDTKRAHLLSLSAPVTSEQTKAARNDYHKQIFVDIGKSSTLTNICSMSFSSHARRFPVAFTQLFLFAPLLNAYKGIEESYELGNCVANFHVHPVKISEVKMFALGLHGRRTALII